MTLESDSQFLKGNENDKAVGTVLSFLNCAVSHYGVFLEIRLFRLFDCFIT